MLQFWEMPSPQPSPTGEGAGCSRFWVTSDLKGSLDLQPLIAGRLKNKKQPAQPIFLAEPLIPAATPSSLPWERARERAASRKACIWAVRVLGKIAAIWRIPSPQPSPTGEGAGCSRFYGYRQFEKQLGFTTVDFRSSEKQKAACTTCFPCRTLNPNSLPVLSPVGES